MESRKILILYGSETGCAQDTAERIGRQSRRRHFKTRVIAMDEYERAQLVEEQLVIFVCSTTGQGDEPTNMKRFWKFLLRKNLPPNILSQMEYTVFGLGDSSYQKFNYPAKKLYKRLSQLGAVSIHSRGDGDDQHYLGMDGGLDPWLDELWPKIMAKYPLPPGRQIIPADSTPPPSFHLEFVKDTFSNDVSKTNEPDLHHEGEFDVIVQKNERITAEDHFQDVRHIELKIQHDNNEHFYAPGDVAVIRPKNLPNEVDAFLEYMNWSDLADEQIIVRPTSEDRRVPSHWPHLMTFRELFVSCLDIFSVPRRSFFEMLAFFTEDENQTEKLREFSSPEGQDDMYAYCQRPRRTVAEVLFDFQSAKIKLDYILDLFPMMQPRSFSIASDPKTHPGEIHLCIAIVKYKTKLKKIRRGVCTKWISQLQGGDTIPSVHITRGTMQLPKDPNVPLIMIGPGTGIAPMRSFLEDRIYHNATENTLFVGCRYEHKDYYYREEWEGYVNKHRLELHTAFSRDQDSKIYVQDLVRQQAPALWRLIDEKKAKVLLSGSSNKMPEQVAFAFKELFMEQGGLDAEQAELYFSRLEKSGQFQQECWA
ncbi:NADPH-dependent diflavin oxidoreductase 1 [Umbelopsis sp. AD052]|nr:NADPH-dependent diflavin oxidoreductase 1 [Umbelopsis sp. AD052]